MTLCGKCGKPEPCACAETAIARPIDRPERRGPFNCRCVPVAFDDAADSLAYALGAARARLIRQEIRRGPRWLTGNDEPRDHELVG